MRRGIAFEGMSSAPKNVIYVADRAEIRFASSGEGLNSGAYRMYPAILAATRSAEFLTAPRSRCA